MLCHSQVIRRKLEAKILFFSHTHAIRENSRRSSDIAGRRGSYHCGLWSGDSLCVSPNADLRTYYVMVRYFRVILFYSLNLVTHGSYMAMVLPTKAKMHWIALDQHEPKIRSTEQGSILCEISTARALRQRSRELSKYAHYFTLSNHHHHWLPPSLVTTLFIDRPSRPQNLTISGKYVLVYCLFVIKAKILPRRDTDERLQVLPKTSRGSRHSSVGFAGTTTCSPSWAAPIVEH